MSVDRTPAHLTDMLDFVRELRALVGTSTLDTYLGQRVLNLAIEKLFINLGEAAQRMSETERARIPDVPWRQIIGLRNILAHGYEQIEHASPSHGARRTRCGGVCVVGCTRAAR